MAFLWNSWRTSAPEKIKTFQRIARKVDFCEPRLLQCTYFAHCWSFSLTGRMQGVRLVGWTRLVVFLRFLTPDPEYHKPGPLPPFEPDPPFWAGPPPFLHSLGRGRGSQLERGWLSRTVWAWEYHELIPPTCRTAGTPCVSWQVTEPYLPRQTPLAPTPESYWVGSGRRGFCKGKEYH